MLNPDLKHKLRLHHSSVSSLTRLRDVHVQFPQVQFGKLLSYCQTLSKKVMAAIPITKRFLTGHMFLGFVSYYSG